ncbi:MAG: hypothetical protein PHU17_00720 [Candidatus Pacebacteria bacterium]|nr:hypothetical protein [Candidatus Paceibacterota bacterium]
MPAYENFQAKSSEADKIRKQIETTQNYFLFSENNFNKLKESKWEEKKKSIEINFTSSPFFFPKTTYFLRTVANQSGMAVSSINNSSSVLVNKTQETFKDQLKGEVKKTTFNLSLEGSYNYFYNFLSFLEKQTRIANIKSINISSATKKDSLEPTFKFSLILDLYSY